MDSKESSNQKFVWPETKNPILIVVRFLGRSTIFLFLMVVYLSNKWGTKLPALIIADLFFISMAWLFLQQKLKVYKLLGWVIVFGAVWLTLVEFFPNTFAITPWW